MNDELAVRVLLVEDSMVVRELLVHLINRDPRLRVVGVAETAERAIELLPRLRPDVISMDIRLPGMDGFKATRWIMANMPTPIVVVSADIDDEALRISMNALSAGALSVVEKPVGTTHKDYEAVARHLCTQLAIMSQVKVVRQRKQLMGSDVAPAANSAVPAETLGTALPPPPYRIVGLVASTGGPTALHAVLADLPANFPVPVAVVQHMGGKFLPGFAKWLDRGCALAVKLAEQGEEARPGVAYVSPGGVHLGYDGRRMQLIDTPPEHGQCPSGNVLFRTIARSVGSKGLGAILTGMGEDGAEGLLDLRLTGGLAIAEDESTAVVHGMPGAAIRLGAVDQVLPLDRIANRIIHAVMPATRSFQNA